MGAVHQALNGLLLASLVGAVAAQPALPDGEKSIVAVTRDGQRTRIGAITFRPVAGGQAGFRVQMDHAVMKDHFLSMREFKCLPAAQEVSCFVPYPYANPATVSAGDWAWLEHNLMFFYKLPTDFGAKLWNGIIFRFAQTDTALVGQPQAIDLNRIGSPPDDLTRPPYGPMERDDFAPGARWIRELRIE